MATSKSATARWNKSQLIEVFIALFFSINRHTKELPAMLKTIMMESNKAYRREKVDIAILSLYDDYSTGTDGICVEINCVVDSKNSSESVERSFFVISLTYIQWPH